MPAGTHILLTVIWAPQHGPMPALSWQNPSALTWLQSTEHLLMVPKRKSTHWAHYVPKLHVKVRTSCKTHGPWVMLRWLSALSPKSRLLGELQELQLTSSHSLCIKGSSAQLMVKHWKAQSAQGPLLVKYLLSEV